MDVKVDGVGGCDSGERERKRDREREREKERERESATCAHDNVRQ